MSVKVKINGEWVTQGSNSGGAVDLDTTLTESGLAADAKATGDAILTLGTSTWEGIETVGKAVEAIPAKVAEDGYTDITGLRKPKNIMFVKSGNTITATATLQGDKTSTSVVTIGENGRPATVTTDGVECTVGWEGFDA